MKVLTILGSPKGKGNTATVLQHFEEIISKDHDVDRVNITKYDVRGCLGCMACQEKPDEPGCIQKDDAIIIINRIIDSDIVIYASPLYCWGFSSQMKALIDRHFCMVTGFGTPQHKSLVQGKPIALLVTCHGPVEGNTDFIQGIFNRVGKFCKCRVIGKYVVPFCTTPDAIDSEALKIGEDMAKNIKGVHP